MSDHKKSVPEPGEAGRDNDDVHYFEVDETNVGAAERSKPQKDEAQQAEADE